MTLIFRRVPFVLLHVDGGGKVLDCESSGHRSIIGRNLLTEVPAFRGAAYLPRRYREFLRSGKDAFEIDLTVEGAQGNEHARLFFGRVCADIVIARITSHGVPLREKDELK